MSQAVVALKRSDMCFIAGIILEYEQADELRNKSIDLLNLSAE